MAVIVMLQQMAGRPVCGKKQVSDFYEDAEWSREDRTDRDRYIPPPWLVVTTSTISELLDEVSVSCVLGDCSRQSSLSVVSLCVLLFSDLPYRLLSKD